MNELRFGTAGIPFCTQPRDTVNGVAQVRALGLGAMELEFVHSVNISEKLAPAVAQAAKENDVTLTCHGQYFINLSSLEKPKQHASVQRILKAAHIANMCGAWSVTFHAGFYQGRRPEEVYPMIRDHLRTIVGTLREQDNGIWVRPETTGKGTQWGDIDEILTLSQEVEGILPCIDFSHIHARSGGKWNTRAEFEAILQKVEKALGKEGLRTMHIHLSGIAYSEKGEKHHLLLDESDMRYKELLAALKDFKCAGAVICESPNIEGDALLLKKTYTAARP